MKIEKVEKSIEKRILTGMIVSDTFLKGIESIYKPEYLTEPAALIADWCMDYYRHYQKAPGRHIQDIYETKSESGDYKEGTIKFIESILATLSSEYDREAEGEFNEQYLMDEAIKYFKSQVLTKTTENIKLCLHSGDLEGAEKALSDFQPIGNTANEETTFAPKTLEELTSEGDESVKWLWERMLPVGAFCLISAYMKTGKSTLVYLLARAIAEGQPFLGMPTKKAPVLILALEEHPADVKRRLKTFARDTEVYVETSHIKGTNRNLNNIASFIKEKGIGFVLIDTISRFWSITDENDNAQIMKATSPLLDICRDTGATFLFIHHDRKTGGEDGRGIRGGSALLGLADQALLLERRQGGLPTQRVLKTLGRYADHSPAELVIELRNHDYMALGTSKEVSHAATLDKIRELVTSEPQTIKALAELAVVSEKEARKALEELKESGEIIRQGQGSKGKPFCYLKDIATELIKNRLSCNTKFDSYP